MTPNRCPSPLQALLLMLISLQALAESPVYKVEILVFAHADAATMNEQSWPRQEVSHQAGAAELSTASGNGTADYQRLPDSNLVLTAEKDSLAREPGFRTLFHSAWYQPMDNENNARPVHLRGGHLMPDGAYELDGYISISIDLDRFLHVRPDLYYSQHSPLQPADGSGTVLTAHMDTPRRISEDKVHYLDHPLFGVLVLIQR